MGNAADKIQLGSATGVTGHDDVVTQDPSAATNVSAAGAHTDFPCSVTQERFWLLDRLEPGNASYNVAVRWRLDGRVSTQLLERAWLSIIERHEILRTVFLEVDGSLVQRVLPALQFRINEIDLSAVAPDLQQAEGDRIGVLEARAPFDLTTGPIVRVALLRFSPSHSIVLVTTHQIVSDGWSIGVMAREMGTFYRALSRGQPSELEPLPIQYADYTLWQLEWLKVRGTQTESDYWTRQLAGIKPFKVIPDRPRPAIPNTSGAIVSRIIPRDLTNRAQALAAERGATLFAAALAALCATLARFTGENEIVLGTQVSGRDQVELEPMIGQFVNSLILRNDLADDPSFASLIERVNDTSQQALEHRHIPIERLLGMLKGGQAHANSPAISVNFIFQKTFIQNTSYGDFSLVDMPSLPAGAIYDLNFFMVERPDGWRLSCQYNTAQFEASTADRLLAYVQSVLDSAVAQPERRVSQLILGPMNETRVLLGKLNDTRSLYPRELSLAKLFEAQAMRAPLATAISSNGRDMSYGDLDAAANKFSEYLHDVGVGLGARVAVCLPPSANLFIAILGILKSGAIYIPMNAGDPPARRARLAAATQPTGVVGQPADLALVTNKATKLIDVAAALAHVPRHPGVGASATVDSDSAACMTFASGGFDAAHGITITHRNLSNLVFSLAKKPGIRESDVIVANRAASPNISFVETFLALLTGARLVLPTDDESSNGRALLRLLQKSGATVMFGSAHTWNTLLKAGWIGFPALKMLCPAAQLTLPFMDRLTALDGELWSVYGHRGSGLWSAIHRVYPKQTFIAIGEPAANSAIYVLDAAAHIAPIGVTGQLYVGGDSIENGEVVPEGMYAGVAPAKLSRTGDAARLRANGQIEYLESLASGFIHMDTYVEPEEIESEILRDPRVGETAVVATDEAAGSGTLTAYLVARKKMDGSSANLVEQVQKRLADVLPTALLPTSYVVLDELPRLSNAAIDRRALRAMRTEGDAAKQSKPVGDAEERLAVIWREMLNAPSVGATDNFFELGGHSLLAARMLAKVEVAFGRRLQLAALFQAPTIRELARALSRTDAREFDFRQMVKLQPNGSKPPIIALNNTGNYYLLAKHLGPEQPFISLQLFDPSVKTDDMPRTLEQVAAEYVQLIRRVQPTGPYNLMGWCVAGALAFEVARQLTDSNDTVQHLFLMDTWVPRYIDRQPMFRRAIAAYTLSWQLIFADWRKYRQGHQTFSAFLDSRSVVRNFKRLWTRLTSGGEKSPVPAYTQATSEDYDRWLLQYLQSLTAKYEPREYSGRITLFRSEDEPTGWLFDPAAGWGNYSSTGVNLLKVPGDHYTMFQSTGAVQMAEEMRTLTES